MTTTVRENNGLATPDVVEPMETALVVVHHPNATFLGLRRVVLPKASVDLGRETGAFGDGSLDHPLISRFHARVSVDARGTCLVNDLGSANGTWLDGVRVVSTVAQVGSIIRVGPVLLAVQHAPASYATRRSTRAPIIAYSTAQCIQRLRLMLSEGGLLLVDYHSAEQTLTYVEWLAGELSLDYRGLVAEANAKQICSLLTHPSVVVVDGRECPANKLPDLQRELSSPALKTAHGSCLLLCPQRDVHSADHESSERHAMFSLPSLAARIEDIPWLIKAALSKADLPAATVDHALAFRLLRASWPENVEGLHRWTAMAARRWGNGEMTVSDEDLKFTGEPTRPASVADASAQHSSLGTSSITTPLLRLSQHGSWFVLNDEPIVDLRTRFALSRILRTLIQQHLVDPHETVSIDALVGAGWPGEKLLGDSGTNRLYVAVATLRKLGLRDAVERREGGYRLAPHWKIELHDSETPSAPSSEENDRNSRAIGQ
jgi:hypothetical protein